ncbi:MAG: glycerophosphodiester phosphodiesterase [Pseudomonadota bacterium]
MPMPYQPPGPAAPCNRSASSTGSAEQSVVALSSRLLFILVTLFAITGCSLYPSLSDLGPLEQQPALESSYIAHRGNISRGALPDNSLPALRQSLAAGVGFLEVDVRRSNDGALFLFHDGSFSRSNSQAPACLRGIPIAQIPSPKRSSVTLDPDGSATVPTLADALSLMAQSHNANGTLQIDLKGESDTLALEVLELVRAQGLLHRVLLQLRTPERIGLVLSHFPKARILARCLSQKQLESALNHRIEAVELERWITSDAVRLAHARGVRVAINIAGSDLDQPSTHHYFRLRGVDRIMTDRGDLSLHYQKL